MQGKGPWMHLGIDESNNGRYPVYFVSVFSMDEKDTDVRGFNSQYLPKNRKHDSSLWGKFGGDKNRNYSFLLYHKSDDDIIENHKSLGVVICSLLNNERIGEKLNLFIDGKHNWRRRDYTKGIVSDYTGIERDLVDITAEAELDRRNIIVNMADEIAHILFNSPKRRIDNKKGKKKELLTDLL